MTFAATMPEPSHIDEPQMAKGYADVFSQVAADQRPVILRRNGEDLAAVIPLEYLELIEDALARNEAERIASQIDWKRMAKQSPPPQEWFDGDEPKPF